ncbi:MAG: ribonuclease [Bacteriovoracaceae bacterium]|nr:ribonuclease [Bacteriovoracaceae bacterium]
MARIDGRKPEDLRELRIVRSPQKDPDGSVLIQWGNTHVLCSVNIEEKVPNWMNGQSSGWITAEYGMLPGSSDKRIQRDKIRTTGRTHEIQRLIGRSIRASLDLKTIGPRTIQIDCDVIQADGGTRVASITGSYLALRLALHELVKRKSIPQVPPTLLIGALSLGRVNGDILLDLNYPEDVKAEVDANLVMNEKMEFVEIQGTAEKGSFSRDEFTKMLDLANVGFAQIFEFQRKILRDWNL